MSLQNYTYQEMKDGRKQEETKTGETALQEKPGTKEAPT